MALLTLIGATCLGAIVLLALYPALLAQSGGLLLFLAAGIGPGLLGCFAAVWLLAGMSLGVGVLLLALTVTLALVAWRRRMPWRVPHIRRPTWLEALAAAVALVVLLLVGATVLLWTRDNPHGGWDAWAIWNLRARMLLRGAPTWRDSFALATYFHPDYPLLLPALVAQAWRFAGTETTSAPLIVALWYGLATLGLLGVALARLRDRLTGLLAVTLLAGTSTFVYNAPAQMADIPLGFFCLALLVLLEVARRERAVAAALIAGLAASMAAWTKNDGLPLLLAAVLALWLTRDRDARRLTIGLIAGALPLLALLALFKSLAPPSEFAAPLEVILARLLDPARYWQIAVALGWWLLAFGRGAIVALAGYLALRGVRRERSAWLVLLVLGVMLLADCLALLVTPYVLAVHVQAFERLLLQLWPGAIFGVMLLAAGEQGQPTLRQPAQSLAVAVGEAPG